MKRWTNKWTNNCCCNLCCCFKEGAFQHAPFILLSSEFAKEWLYLSSKKDFISKQWIVRNWKALHETPTVLQRRQRAKFVIERCRCHLFIGKINCIIHLVCPSFLPILMIQTEVTYFCKNYSHCTWRMNTYFLSTRIASSCQEPSRRPSATKNDLILINHIFLNQAFTWSAISFLL